MEFQFKPMDEVPRDGRNLPDAGRYNLALTKLETGSSKKGDPQLIAELTVDSGPNSGYKVKQYLTFTGNDIAWAQLANMCDGADFHYEEASSLESFAAQFPLDGSFRFSADLEPSFSISAYLDDTDKKTFTQHAPDKTETCIYGPYWLDCQKSEYEAWEGEKFAKAQIRDGFDFQNIYGPPSGEAELKKEPEMAMAGGDGETFHPDDDLPF